MLRHVAALVDSEKRSGDMVARYGGEEPAAILPHTADLETATSGGRRYVMGKLLAQLGEAASAAEPGLPDRRRRTIRNTLTLLAQEAERLLPDAEAFARGARLITSALTHV